MTLYLDQEKAQHQILLNKQQHLQKTLFQLEKKHAQQTEDFDNQDKKQKETLEVIYKTVKIYLETK